MPPEVGTEPAKRPAPRWAILVATVLGIGYAPIASGTFGSLPGLALAWTLDRGFGAWGIPACLVILVPLGIRAADHAARHFGRPDPKPVVVDEVAGQVLTLAGLPLSAPVMAAGFVVFRALDVWKPFPADRLESLPGGSGIMADDLMAAVYGNVLLRIGLWVGSGWMGPS